MAALAVGVPDLLLTDLRLPDGHGLDVIRAYRHMAPGGKVLIITGSPMGDEHMKQVSDLGPHGLIAKPFETDELLAEVRKALP